MSECKICKMNECDPEDGGVCADCREFTATLKPCPFCGAVFDGGNSGLGADNSLNQVHCMGCGVEASLDTWNRRKGEYYALFDCNNHKHIWFGPFGAYEDAEEFVCQRDYTGDFTVRIINQVGEIKITNNKDNSVPRNRGKKGNVDLKIDR